MLLERPVEDVAAESRGLEAGLEVAITSHEIGDAVAFTCTSADVDEGQAEFDLEEFQAVFDPSRPATPELRDRQLLFMAQHGLLDARGLATSALESVIFTGFLEIGMQRMHDVAVLSAYGHWRAAHGHGGSKKRRVPVDVDKMVDMWVEAFVLMSTSHSHAGYTDADHQSDELLGPMLLAPIAQIREWAGKLATRLEADERVPFLVWSSFKRAVEPLIMRTPAGAAITLKTQLAREVAELVEGKLDQAEIVAAIAGALQWRPPAQLEKVRAAIQSGEKPHVTGRQSCLFLEAGGQRVVL